MNRLLLTATVAAAALGLGCAAAPPTRDELHGKVVCNGDYVNAVHYLARMSGAKVVWTRCPDQTLRIVPAVNPGEVG